MSKTWCLLGLETYPLHLLATISLLLPTIIIEIRSAIRQFLNILITSRLSHFFFQHLCVQNNRFQSRARPLPLPSLSPLGLRREERDCYGGRRTADGREVFSGAENCRRGGGPTQSRCDDRGERKGELLHHPARKERESNTQTTLGHLQQFDTHEPKRKGKEERISIREIEVRQAPLNWKKEETEERD